MPMKLKVSNSRQAKLTRKAQELAWLIDSPTSVFHFFTALSHLKVFETISAVKYTFSLPELKRSNANIIISFGKKKKKYQPHVQQFKQLESQIPILVFILFF